MKKIIKKICKFIGKIIKFLDQIIVTPIMKFFIKIMDFFQNNGKGFEKLITTKSSLLIISLLIAFLTFYIVDKNSSSLLNNSAEKIYGQSVKAIYNEEAYIVEGLPDSVDVILMGRSTDIFLAKQYPSQEISVDLRELSVGTHKVALKYRESFSFVEYKIDPSYVTVVIYDKVSSTREITYEILHRKNLDSKLDISNVTLSKSEVTIKGSEKRINEVAYVKALVDVDNLVNPVVGTSNVKGVKLVAYNDTGNVVDVEILPSTVEATLTLTSSSKIVPIKVIPQGKLALGYAIGALTPSSNSVEVYGSEESLANIDYIPIYVDVDGISNDKTFNVNVTKPTGIREIGLKTITVKLSVAEEKQKEVPDVGVLVINLNPSLTVHAVSKDYNKITVIVKGSAKALEALDTDKITATIDLEKYTKPGEYEVDVKVSGDDLKLIYTSKTTKVKVNITKK